MLMAKYEIKINMWSDIRCSINEFMPVVFQINSYAILKYRYALSVYKMLNA